MSPTIHRCGLTAPTIFQSQHVFFCWSTFLKQLKPENFLLDTAWGKIRSCYRSISHHLIVKHILFFFFYVYVRSTHQCSWEIKQGGIFLRCESEVPSIGKHAKTCTWTKQCIWSPKAVGRDWRNLIRHKTFSRRPTITTFSLGEFTIDV